jgi:hypothetical protein
MDPRRGRSLRHTEEEVTHESPGRHQNWPVDAEWTADGALCVNHDRGGSEPSCYAQKPSATCGSFASGALPIDEYGGQ